MELSYRVVGADALLSTMSAAPELAINELTAATWEAALMLEATIKDKTPVGVGGGAGLRGSIAAQPPRVGGGMVVGEVSSSAPHAVPVELGTKPHMPPIQPIADWVRYKLQVDPVEVDSVALAIAYKISRVGTQGVFMFSDSFSERQDDIETIYAEAGARFVARVAGGG